VIDSREWTIAVLVSVVIGVGMAALDAPTWLYPVALAAFIIGLLIYQRQRRRTSNACNGMTMTRRGARSRPSRQKRTAAPTARSRSSGAKKSRRRYVVPLVAWLAAAAIFLILAATLDYPRGAGAAAVLAGFAARHAWLRRSRVRQRVAVLALVGSLLVVLGALTFAIERVAS
jgi:hypothetical protein